MNIYLIFTNLCWPGEAAWEPHYSVSDQVFTVLECHLRNNQCEEMTEISCSHLQLLSSFCWAKALKFIKSNSNYLCLPMLLLPKRLARGHSCYFLRHVCWMRGCLLTEARLHDPVCRMAMVDCLRVSSVMLWSCRPGWGRAGWASLLSWPGQSEASTGPQEPIRGQQSV